MKEGLHITVKHNGKMKGMQSLSTSCLCNKYCQAYSKDKEKVCSRCYAQRQLKMYKHLDKRLEANTHILSERTLKRKEIPLLNCSFFRFEAFGDVNNLTQIDNYCRICRANKYTNFSIWSKNLFLFDDYFKKHKKPKNLLIIASSPFLNQIANYESYDFIDKVFTVYDKDYIKKNNIEINCGSKNCSNCKKCYLKSDKDFFINEKLK